MTRFRLVESLLLLAAIGYGALVHAEPVSAIQQQVSDPPRELLVQLQQALNELAKGELALKQSVSDLHPAALTEARDALRSAIAQFGQVRASVDEKLAQLYSRPRKKTVDGWTVDELESLRRNLSLKWGRALRHQALCYPHQSPDRVNSLDKAIEQLDDLTSSTSNDPAIWQARGDVLVCLRLLGQDKQADERLIRWESRCPPSMRNRLIRQFSAIEKDITAASEQPHSGEELYASGKLAEAVAAYDREAELARDASDLESYLQSAQTAAAICYKMAKPQAAVGRYRRLAMNNQNHPLAAELHLTAIGIVVAKLRSAAADQKLSLIEQYEKLLAEHLEHWPESPQAAKVRTWQNRLAKVRPAEQ